MRFPLLLLLLVLNLLLLLLLPACNPWNSIVNAQAVAQVQGEGDVNGENENEIFEAAAGRAKPPLRTPPELRSQPPVPQQQGQAQVVEPQVQEQPQAPSPIDMDANGNAENEVFEAAAGRAKAPARTHPRPPNLGKDQPSEALKQRLREDSEQRDGQKNAIAGNEHQDAALIQGNEKQMQVNQQAEFEDGDDKDLMDEQFNMEIDLLSNDELNRRVVHGDHTHSVRENIENSDLIALVLLTVIVISQIGLIMWQRHSPTSYDRVSLAGLWLIPFIWSLSRFYWRMLIVWTFYSVFTAIIMRKALQRRVTRRTPRRVFQWFNLCYKTCVGLVFFGYGLVVLDVFNFVDPVKYGIAETGFLFLFYGLYFGVLSRDLCSLCGESMAVNIGYIGKKGEIPSKSLPSNMCALCGSALHASIRLTDGNKNESSEQIYTLNCQHSFHEFCLRGWTIIGKRDTCPYCSEKVRLQSLLRNPWENRSALWGKVLDALRYMIVFNPIIIIIAKYILTLVY